MIRRGLFDRDDRAELVRRDAGDRRVDFADYSGRQRGRFLGAAVVGLARHEEGREDLEEPRQRDIFLAVRFDLC